MFSWEFFLVPFWTTRSQQFVPASPFFFISPGKGNGAGSRCLTIQYIELHFDSHFQNGTLSLPLLVPGVLKSISQAQFFEMVCIQEVVGRSGGVNCLFYDFQPILLSQAYSPSHCPLYPFRSADSFRL